MKRFWQFLVLAILVACQPMTAIPTPTATAIPAINNTPTVVPISETPSRYELSQPQPEELLKMIDAVLLMEEQFAYQENVEAYILEREPGALQQLIGKDFEKYYLDGFSGADDLVIRDTSPWELKSFGDLSSFSPVLRIAALQYINGHQDLLVDGSLSLPNSDISIFSMDLNGDGNLEWLIGLEYQNYSLQNWLLISKQIDDRYHFIPGLEYDWVVPTNSAPDIEVRDLTGDGNEEIIKVQRYYFAGGIHGGMEVYTWKNDRLSLLKSIDLPSVPPIYGEANQSEYVIDDFDDDGIDDIRVSWPRFRRFDCRWTQLSTYYLDGRIQDIEIEGEEIPATDECLIARALESDELEERIQLYQEAIEKFDSLISPLDKLAWLRLRLAMTYTATGDDDRAASQLQDLIDMNSDGEFRKFIKDAHVDNNSPSPLVLCDALYSSIASQDIPDNLGSEIDADLAHWAYPIDFAPIADLICPFPSVIADRLGRVKISLSESPIDTLVAQGYPFTWIQSMDWDGDAGDEWLGLLNFRQPMLLMINDKENWQIDVFVVPLSIQSDVEMGTYVPADSAESVLLMLFLGEGRFCDQPNTAKWLIKIHTDTMEYDSRYLCDSYKYSFASQHDIQLALEEFSKSYYTESFEAPGWYYLSVVRESGSERPTILDLVGEIENNVVNQIDQGETVTRIAEIIDSLPVDDPAARLLINRLYYLRGLNYELAGQDEEAVAAYLELIEFSPESLWSQYARIRIEPIQP